MSQERRKTRDLLLEYHLGPYYPRAGGLSIVYPWENVDITIFEHQFFEMARQNGFEGTKEDFWEAFSSQSDIVAEQVSEFPVPGNPKTLYYDNTTGIVYSFKNITDEEVLQKELENGGIEVGQSEDGETHYVYAPIQATPTEGLTFYGGGA